MRECVSECEDECASECEDECVSECEDECASECEEERVQAGRLPRIRSCSAMCGSRSILLANTRTGVVASALGV